MRIRLAEPPKALAGLLALYFLTLLLLLSRQPLWLDEIIDLRGIRDYGLLRLLAWVPANAGGTPLGYLTRFASIHLLGYSLLSARLPSALFSVAACAGVFALARQARLRLPLLALALFAFAPLQLRYGWESRPYSMALAFSVWATVVFCRMCVRLRLSLTIWYAALLLLGLYTQPFTAFVPVAHIVWLVLTARQPGRARLLRGALTGSAVASLLFLPWYRWATEVWAQSAQAGHLHYFVDGRVAVVILHELTGAGYFGSMLLIGIAGLGFARLPTASEKLFWSLLTLLPIVLAVLADRVFGYFFAIRQILFVLAPLSILAAKGLEGWVYPPKRMRWIAVGVLVVIFIVADVRSFTRPRENWQAAADRLQSLAASGSCIVFAPADSAAFYTFFVPELAQATCPADLAHAPSVAVAISPYGGEASMPWLPSGFEAKGTFNPAGPQIRLYRRPSGS